MSEGEEKEVEEMDIQNPWIEGPIRSCQGWVGAGEVCILVCTTQRCQRVVVGMQESGHFEVLSSGGSRGCNLNDRASHSHDDLGRKLN